jgi:anti-anti-sigma factor
VSALPVIFSIEADGVAIARVEGEIGRGEMKAMVDALSHLVARGIFEFVVDFSEVTHVDYRGLHALVRFAKSLQKLGGELKASGLSPYIYAIFCSTGAQETFHYYEGKGRARAAFGSLAMEEARLSP